MRERRKAEVLLQGYLPATVPGRCDGDGVNQKCRTLSAGGRSSSRIETGK